MLASAGNKRSSVHGLLLSREYVATNGCETISEQCTKQIGEQKRVYFAGLRHMTKQIVAFRAHIPDLISP
jgi:hypothetical protein